MADVLGARRIEGIRQPPRYELAGADRQARQPDHHAVGLLVRRGMRMPVDAIWVACAGKDRQQPLARANARPSWTESRSDEPRSGSEIVAKASGFSPFTLPPGLASCGNRPVRRATLSASPQSCLPACLQPRGLRFARPSGIDSSLARRILGEGDSQGRRYRISP